MGNSASLAGALFPATQRRVLALLYGQPERSFTTAELIRLAKAGTGGVHRLLTRLTAAGWVKATPVGNQRHWRADRDCPAFAELRALVLKTLVPPPPVRRGRSAAPAPASPPAPPAGEGWKSW